MIKIFKITEKLSIGNDNDCDFKNDIEELPVDLPSSSLTTIHACKTCHQKALSYKGNMHQNDINYLVYEQSDNLFLNIVDMEQPLLHQYAGPIMKAALDFIEKNIKENSILIHCNQGLSRAPSIALVYLAKRTKLISNESYYAARQEFSKLFPAYDPSNGIAVYLENHWEEIL